MTLKLAVGTGKEVLEQVGRAAHEFGIEVFVVGGFVRDLYMGYEVPDIDFVVVGDAIAFARYFRKKFSAGKVVVYQRFGTAMLRYRNWHLEFATARTEHYQEDTRKPVVKSADLHSDLSRRDFTVNCLAMHITPAHFGEVLDPFAGIQDIKQGVIRTPLDPLITFNDDPLRILRGIRFAARFGFQIEEQTYQALVQARKRLEIVSQERKTEEFRKMLLHPVPSPGLSLLKKTGVAAVIFPELEQLGGIEQRKEYHHKDVFEHTLQVVDNISQATDRFELRLAALLHDIAKPQTKRFVDGLGWTFHGHEELGARMTERIGRRMRLPLNTIKYTQKLVRLHLRPISLVGDAVTESAIRRLLVEAGAEIDDLMILCRADITSKNRQKVRQYLANFDHLEKRMKIVEEKDRLREFKPAINGNKIMEYLKIPPGKVIGEIKQAIVDAILDGEISNEPEACFEYFLQIKDRFFSAHKD